MAGSRNMGDDVVHAEEAAAWIRGRIFGRQPQVAVVLGSGLGDFAEDLADAVSIPYADIPHFPKPTAVGHAGRLVVGTVGGTMVAAMQGRVHLYEGHSAAEAAFPIRVLARLGVGAVVLTNAAGGINTSYTQGILVLLKDHINLLGQNPLTGPNDDRFGPRFPDMSDAYSKALRGVALEEAARLGIALPEGVYAALLGPSYETPAEIRYLRTIGADVVGMSTVHEVIVARHMGLEVMALSCVTNMASGILDQKLSHEEVVQTGARTRGTFLALLQAVLPRIPATLGL